MRITWGMGLFTWAHVRLGTFPAAVCPHICCQTKVAQEDFPPIWGNEDVLGLDVFVEHSLRMDEINGVTDLENDFLHSPIILGKWVTAFRNVGLEVTPSAIVQNKDHLFAAGVVEPVVEGDDVWVGRDEEVVIYFTTGLSESVICVISARFGDADDFHGATDAFTNQGERFDIDDLVDVAESALTNEALDVVPTLYHLSNEGGLVATGVQVIGETHSVGGWMVQ
jgi:hypothetical protein